MSCSWVGLVQLLLLPVRPGCCGENTPVRELTAVQVLRNQTSCTGNSEYQFVHYCPVVI